MVVFGEDDKDNPSPAERDEVRALLARYEARLKEEGGQTVSKAGRKVLEALREFGDVLKSGEPLGRHFTVRSYALPAEPAEYDGPAIRAVRDRYGMSQALFTRFLCVAPATLQSWEQGRRRPSPIARRLLDELVAGPEHFRARFAELAAPKAVQALKAVTGRKGGTGKRIAAEESIP